MEMFERELCRFLKVKYCVCVNSGTSGLMLVMRALSLKGEVIVPSFTFSGTVHALTWNNLKPAFVDIDPHQLNATPTEVQRAITGKTSAILAVHLFGNPCDIRGYERLAKKYGLKLIFDSAHAFGSQYRGKNIGRFGDAEVFSFHSSKILPAIEGGAVVTNNKDLYQKLRLLRNQGNRGDGNCLLVGLNAKMHPVSAACGLLYMRTIFKELKRRRKLGQYYFCRLSKIPGLRFQKINRNVTFNYQYIPIILSSEIFGLSRDVLASRLLQYDINTRKYFCPPIHRFHCYRHLPRNCALPQTEAIAKNILCLPFPPGLTGLDIERVCDTIQNLHNRCRPA